MGPCVALLLFPWFFFASRLLLAATIACYFSSVSSRLRQLLGTHAAGVRSTLRALSSALCLFAFCLLQSRLLPNERSDPPLIEAGFRNGDWEPRQAGLLPSEGAAAV